jgi:hypothetical protein
MSKTCNIDHMMMVSFRLLRPLATTAAFLNLVSFSSYMSSSCFLLSCRQSVASSLSLLIASFLSSSSSSSSSSALVLPGASTTTCHAQQQQTQQQQQQCTKCSLTSTRSSSGIDINMSENEQVKHYEDTTGYSRCQICGRTIDEGTHVNAWLC